MKICSFLMVLILLAVRLPCAMADEPTDTDALLADFSSLVQAKEQLYRIETDMYKAVLQFVINNDYDSLLTARTLCSQAVQEIRDFQPPEMMMSDSMILYYLEKGVEVDGLEAEFLTLRREISSFLAEAETLEACLYTSVYRVSGLPQLAALASSVKELLDSSAVYDTYAVEYPLSPLAQEGKVEQFKRDMGRFFPEDWLETEADQNQQSAAIQRKINQLSTTEKIYQNTYLLFGSGQDDPNSEPYGGQDPASDVNIIKGMPAMIPSPEWPGGETTVLQASEGQTDSGMPALMSRSYSGITMEEFHAYFDTLASLGIGTFYLTDGGEAEKSVVTLEGGSFSFYRTPEGQAAIVYDPHAYTLEPAWYVQYAE